MYQTIKTFSEQFRRVEIPTINAKDIRQIYCVGMGGSALAVKIINDCFEDVLNIRLIQDYHLPKNIGLRDLVLVCSYSGNTEEVLSALTEAIASKACVVVQTHGGELERRARAAELPILSLPQCAQPRLALGHFFTQTILLLEQLGILLPQKRVLDELSSFLRGRVEAHEKIGRDLAKKLEGRIPLIYSARNLQGVCHIWKVKMNENAKIPCFSNVFPELNHNELQGFGRFFENLSIICLRSQLTHPRNTQRMSVMEIVIPHVPFHFVDLEGETLLQSLFDANGIGDFASYYLAQAYGVDPEKVELVESFKKKLTGPMGS